MRFLFLFMVAALPVSFAYPNCKTITEDVIKLAANANSVEIKENLNARSITDGIEIKALLNFISNHSKDWCKPQFSSAPSGNTTVTFKNKNKDLWSFKIGTNFIGEGWYVKNLSQEEIAVVRRLIQN